MGHYDWIHTWAAQYSPLDTKLMVGGVVDEMSGEIAIFSTGAYSSHFHISMSSLIESFRNGIE